MKKSIIEEVSAGGVVYRMVGNSAGQLGQLEFLIGKHSGYHKWVLPKGLVERGESYIECATREVFEEVGVRGKVVDERPVKTIEYYYMADMEEVANKNPHTEDTIRRVKKYQEDGGAKVKVHKKVYFYLMELVDDSGEHGWEMEDRAWVSYDEAMQRLAFESEKEIMISAYEALH